MATTCEGSVVVLLVGSFIRTDSELLPPHTLSWTPTHDPNPPGCGPSSPSFTYSRASSRPPPSESPSHADDADLEPSYVPEQSSSSNDCDFRGLSARHSRTKVKKMNKPALKRAKDWRERVKFYTDRILTLPPEAFVALDDRPFQMTPTDFCFVVKSVGQVSWQRAMEVYEWLNLRHWYSPNPRMVATIMRKFKQQKNNHAE